MPYQCFADDGNEAILLVTNLGEGDTQGVCPEHLADWGLAFLQSVTGSEWAVSATFPDERTGDATDEDDAADAAPAAPEPEPVPEPVPDVPFTPDQPDDDDDQGDQLAEDNAVRDADLRAELAGRSHA